MDQQRCSISNSFSDLDLLFKVTDPFSAEITKLKIVITLLFLARFQSNFTGMDSRSTPSL